MSVTDADFSDSVSAGVASTVLRGENLGRTEITVCNTHATQDAFLMLTDQRGIEKPAVLNKGVYLKAAGGSWSSNSWKGSITCIATGAATVLTVVDF